jgi:hypothetical protein
VKPANKPEAGTLLWVEEEIPMRMLLQVTIPHEPFNAAVRDGTVGEKINRILDATKPEAVYFTEQLGQRGAVLVVDVPDPSKIPALAEPWFLTFEADVEIRVAMTPDDLRKSGIDAMGKNWT